MGNKDKYFEFTVQLTGEEGKTYQDSYAITGGSYDANPASIEIKPGETTKATFYLKDGDTIHIENLPYGVEYKVSETPVADYVTTETGTEGEVDGAVEQASFTNTKGGTVDAGVVLDSGCTSGRKACFRPNMPECPCSASRSDCDETTPRKRLRALST